MKVEIPIEQLLRWRLARAESGAPPAPRAKHLLELARPWWVVWPEQFKGIAERLSRIRVAYGHAMADSRQPRNGHPVPVLLVRAGEEVETSVCVLYLNVRDHRLRLRFLLGSASGEMEPIFDATFVSDKTAQPLFSAPASRSVDSEYRVDAELSAELARDWEQLKVTDRMPFRLVLRANLNQG